jgi:hypothetical protein
MTTFKVQFKDTNKSQAGEWRDDSREFDGPDAYNAARQYASEEFRAWGQPHRVIRVEVTDVFGEDPESF